MCTPLQHNALPASHRRAPPQATLRRTRGLTACRWFSHAPHIRSGRVTTRTLLQGGLGATQAVPMHLDVAARGVAQGAQGVHRRGSALRSAEAPTRTHPVSLTSRLPTPPTPHRLRKASALSKSTHALQEAQSSPTGSPTRSLLPACQQPLRQPPRTWL